MVTASLSSAWGKGPTSGWGAKILHASQQKKKKKPTLNRSNIVTNLIKIFKMVHAEKNLKK